MGNLRAYHRLRPASITLIRLALVVANVNERAIGIEPDVAFGLLKVVADIWIVLQTSRDFFGSMTRDLADP